MVDPRPDCADEGIAESVASAIAERRALIFARPDEQIVYEVAQQPLQQERVDDTTCDSACKQLGEQGVVDLTGIVGSYTLLSIVMNGAQTPPPPQCSSRLPARG